MDALSVVAGVAVGVVVVVLAFVVWLVRCWRESGNEWDERAWADEHARRNRRGGDAI